MSLVDQMIKVLATLPQLTDATAFYRGTYPLGKLNREGHIQLILNNDWAWYHLCMGNILFMQRPFLDGHVKLAEMAKTQGVPIVIDYDDDFLSCPTDNPNYETYSRPEIRENIYKLVNMADAVIVSTVTLIDRLKKLNPNVRAYLIHNATDFELMDRLVVPFKEPQKIVMWRGTNTHERDLMSIGHELIEVACANPDWKFYFIGYKPWFLMERMLPNQAVHIPGKEIFDYLKYLQELQPGIMIVPLANNEFNQAKSNIAWQEGTMAGSIVIAKGLSEWQQPGILSYQEPHAFKDLLENAIQSEFTGAVLKSFEHIKENYNLEKTNQQRLKVFHELASCPPPEV